MLLAFALEPVLRKAANKILEDAKEPRDTPYFYTVNVMIIMVS